MGLAAFLADLWSAPPPAASQARPGHHVEWSGWCKAAGRWPPLGVEYAAPRDRAVPVGTDPEPAAGLLGATMTSDHDFEAFYQASYPRLVGQLTVVTGSLEDAEDAVQEAFARASTRWARLRAYDAPEAWVRRVALNLATSGLRRARRQAAAPGTVGGQ